MIDLGGTVVTLTRADAVVAGIVAGRVGNDDAAANYVVPFVVIREQTTTRSPANNARIGKQTSRYAALCYGVNRVQAAALARAVSEVWHERGVGPGNGGALIRQAWTHDMDGTLNDPTMRKPFATVYITVLAEAQPLT